MPCKSRNVSTVRNSAADIGYTAVSGQRLHIALHFATQVKTRRDNRGFRTKRNFSIVPRTNGGLHTFGMFIPHELGKYLYLGMPFG